MEKLFVLVELNLLLNEVLGFLERLRVRVPRTSTKTGFFDRQYTTIRQRVALFLESCYYRMVEKRLKFRFFFQILYYYLVRLVIQTTYGFVSKKKVNRSLFVVGRDLLS